MSQPYVTDECVARTIAGGDTPLEELLALDLRDARAEVEQLKQDRDSAMSALGDGLAGIHFAETETLKAEVARLREALEDVKERAGTAHYDSMVSLDPITDIIDVASQALAATAKKEGK